MTLTRIDLSNTDYVITFCLSSYWTEPTVPQRRDRILATWAFVIATRMSSLVSCTISVSYQDIYHEYNSTYARVAVSALDTRQTPSPIIIFTPLASLCRPNPYFMPPRRERGL
jgi:hypothetical protein